MKPQYTIIGYNLRVAILYQDRENFDFNPHGRTWREVSYRVGPEYGKNDFFSVAMILDKAKACAAVLDQHEKDEHGIPMWKGMEAIGATVIGFGAVLEPVSHTDVEAP